MNFQTGYRRVAITGYGSICSLGQNTQEIWDAILNYRVGYKKEVHPDASVVAKFFGNIPFSPDVSRFSKKLLKNLPKFSKLGLIAADEAIKMAFGHDKAALDESYSPFERGVIFGTGWGGEDATVENSNSYADQGIASPMTNIMSMHSVGTAAISMNWNLRGYQNTPVAACATGSMAIGDAFELIRSGRTKMMLAGGGESIRDPFIVWSIDILGALSKEQESVEKACCPFSKDRSGFVMSEGAAILCLEDYDSAVARGAKILAEVVGYGNYSDASDMTAPAPDCQGRVMAIQAALEQAKLSASDIHYINAHGTSTPLNDINETDVLKMSLGEHAYRIPTSSTKSYTGHLIAGAGAIESIFCIKAMETATIPATMHLNNPDPLCDLDYVPNTHRTNQVIDTTLNVNYGFGGTNCALIFRKADR
ncbi:beta-ketoacyl-[acyl-carrier-protein] synthase family protein [Photorhabdus viridis]|uniref:beta-ketoacyl-[acyl-carrier-protein] synthase family protein n=1 Tax=Photorhabdus viridis TaxID=3163327 RepID=UPI003306EC4E